MCLLKYFRKKKAKTETDVPLMPRTLNQNLIGLAYEDYIKQRKINKIVEYFDEIIPLTETFTEFNKKIEFLIDTVEDLSNSKKEINELWGLCFNLIEESKGVKSLQELYIYPLVSLTGEAKFNIDELEKLDSTLDSKIKFKLESIFKSNIDFSIKIEELINWYQYHIKYLNHWGLGISTGETAYLKKIVESNLSSLENLKSTNEIFSPKFCFFVNKKMSKNTKKVTIGKLIITNQYVDEYIINALKYFVKFY